MQSTHKGINGEIKALWKLTKVKEFGALSARNFMSNGKDISKHINEIKTLHNAFEHVFAYL